MKSMAEALELLLYLVKIINLAVENNIDSIVAPTDRLCSSGQINNRQPAHTNRSAAEDTFPLIIWSPVFYDATHGIKHAPSH
jgi:hypothetical protein